MPFFLNPFAFAALSAVPVLVGIYYLRNRFRKRVVSSLILWEALVKSHEGGQKKDQLQLPLLFFLEILAIVCLGFAATQPFFKTTNNRIPVTVILDDSFSLLASETGNGEDSVQQELKEALSELVSRNLYEFEFMLAGESPRRIGEATARTPREVDAALANWKCEQSNANLDAAIEEVKKMHTGNHRILVLTDEAPSLDYLRQDRELHWISRGKHLKNLAISFAARSPITTAPNQGQQLLVRLDRYAGKEESGTDDLPPSSVDILIRRLEDESLIARNSTRLSPGTSSEIMLKLPDEASGSDLIVEVEDDALQLDNRITLLAEKKAELSVYLSIDDPNYRQLWQEALNVLPQVQINQLPASEADLVISQKDYVPRDEQWHIYCPPQKKPVAFAGPYALSSDHPLVRGLPINNSIWAADPSAGEELSPEIEAERTTAEAQETPPGSPRRARPRSVLRSGQTDLVSETNLRRGAKRIRINLSPEFSTVQLSPPSWLILVVNLIQWKEAHLHGPEFTNTWRNRQTVRFPLDTTEALLTHPSGEKSSIQVIGGQARIETPEVGVWSITPASGGPSGGPATDPWRWSFFALSSSESDLSTATSETFDNWQELESEKRIHFRPFDWLFGLIAFSLVVVCCLFHNRKAG